ncbi:MAG: glycosyltransferase [Gemmatimonadetes bacterium]|nr:glycosyltransferase [Gemmatimonadota bacterium]
METSRTPHLSVIVPAYNGEDRLPGALAELGRWLDSVPYSTELILVDDHSRAPAQKVLADFAASRPNTRVIRNETNLGKGTGVAKGFLAATGDFRVFTDADLAYPPAEISKILGDLEAGADVAIACRVLPESRYLMSPSFFHYLYTRHVMSRVFNLMVRAVLLRDILDTQAGLKGFTAKAAAVVFPRLTIPRFGFDVESLFIAQLHGFRVKQTAVHFRYDEEPTTITFTQSVFRMMADLLHVRVNHLRGRYR